MAPRGDRPRSGETGEGSKGTMANERTTRSGQNRIFILLLMFAAVSSGVKDLDRLRDLTRSLHNVAASWMQIGSTVYASGLAAEPRSCPEVTMVQEKSQDFHWVGPIASGQSIEIRGINGGITAEPAPGSDLEVFAVKKGRRSDPASDTRRGRSLGCRSI